MIGKQEIARMSESERQFFLAFTQRYPEKKPHFYDKQILKGRRWRYDFVWCYGVGGITVEIQGGIWMYKSAHSSAKGILRDIDKLNQAQLAGYLALQVPGHLAAEDYYLDTVAAAVEIAARRALL